MVDAVMVLFSTTLSRISQKRLRGKVPIETTPSRSNATTSNDLE